MAANLTYPVYVSSSRDRNVPATAGANPRYPGVPSGTFALSDAGSVVVTQTRTLGFNGSTAVDGTFILPRNSQIIDIQVLVTTVFNSAGSNTLSIGWASGGTQLLTSLDVKTAAGRIPLTATHVTGTQAANWISIGANTTIVATQTPAGGAASAGSVTVTISYTTAA